MLPELVKDEIGVLGMKPLGSGLFLRSEPMAKARDHADRVPAVRDEPADVGGDHRLRHAGDPHAGHRRRLPLASHEVSREKRAALARTAAVARHGEWEKYKTTETFDGTAQHPWWLETASLQK